MKLLEQERQMLKGLQTVRLTGRVTGVRGLSVCVGDFPAPLGAQCRIRHGGGDVEAQVIGFSEGQTLVMPMGSTAGIAPGDLAVCTGSRQAIGVGDDVLGRVLDAAGRPIDGDGPLRGGRRVPLWPGPMSPMSRRPIERPLGTGIRAIDALLTVGAGQRMAILSGSGVGKSVLLGMVARYTSADATVIALIGERGREVREFVERHLGPDGLRRAVVVASTGDESPLARLQAAAAATAIAEYLRDQGRQVLLLMDSLTRLAAAQRQIGLAAGEPPATKGYPPSVFSLLPQLLERCGRTEKGSISGFYTVLVEGDDPSDPVADAVRSVTDGHIVLSRELANRGQYPAVDVLASVSRVMTDVTDEEHRQAAKRLCRLAALFADVEDLVNVGAYRSGASPETDLAVYAMPLIRRFLGQATEEPVELARTREELLRLLSRIDAHGRRLMGRGPGGGAANAGGDHAAEGTLSASPSGGLAGPVPRGKLQDIDGTGARIGPADSNATNDLGTWRGRP